MLTELLFFVSGFYVIDLSQATLAPFITKCRSDDGECARKNAEVAIPLFAAGIPELGIETLDPSFFDIVDCSKLNLKFFVYNFTIIGWKNCIPIDVHRDAPKSKLYVKLSCHSVGYGQYELTGKVLALNIRGRGTLHVLLRRYFIAADMDVQLIDGKDNKKHLNITNFKYTFDLIEKSDIVFENMFQGNEALSMAATEVIKNSGNEIVREVGDPMFHASIVRVIKNLNNFFNVVPMDELSID